MPRVRVYLATSLDGRIAGPDDDLSWLPADAAPGPGALSFDDFLAEIGALLMGRSTYDVVAGFEEWPYAERPVLVASHRQLQAAPASVQRVEGEIGALLDRALAAADGGDVYLDGGTLVQQALAADRVDELILTVAPTVLGAGPRLFGPLAERRGFTFGPPATFGSMVQLRANRSPT